MDYGYNLLLFEALKNWYISLVCLIMHHHCWDNMQSMLLAGVGEEMEVEGGRREEVGGWVGG